MIQSMTGYASLERNVSNGTIQVELRSVNQRYLELNLKLDERCRLLESKLREQLKARVGRGKVECRLSFVPTVSQQGGLKVNHDALGEIAKAVESAQTYFPQAQPVNIIDILNMPNVLHDDLADETILEEEALLVLNETLDKLIEARAREGEKLKEMILDRLNESEQQVAIVKPLMPALLKAYQAKLKGKLQEVVAVDEERIQQEMVLYAQKIDIDEELSRLDAHISEVASILDEGGLVGKRLDFLMQEMNREANTLGSKSIAIETTKVSMQLKVLIEQMREQIQNIE